jgi:two-component system cell cycle response regulator DivK
MAAFTRNSVAGGVARAPAGAERRRGRSEIDLRGHRAALERQWFARHSSGIMLVNCLPDEQHMYSFAFTTAGFDPIVTCEVGKALELATCSPPAAIITDMTLDGGRATALQLIGAVRAHERTRHTLIVVISGYVFPRDRQSAVDAGADVFLPKPCAPDMLVRTVLASLTRMRADIDW